MMRAVSIIALLCCLLGVAVADVNMQHPRGSNNRLDENSRPRKNANRLFDSQNNNRGGTNVGEEMMNFHVGSRLRVEWTNQHSCGDENNDCDIIIQYACENDMRNGESTSTIKSSGNSCRSRDCNTDKRYGMHEDFYSYKHCAQRERNKGLFTSDQNVGSQARTTRQNAGGTRRGYECAEERDYYPYWGPTIWKDVVIFTNNKQRCGKYRSESENVKGRWQCDIAAYALFLGKNNVKVVRGQKQKYIPITKEACEKFKYLIGRTVKTGVWKYHPKHEDHEAPECFESQYTRDNHQGNTKGGVTPHYMWTIPKAAYGSCVLRLRYNITSGEFNRDKTDHTFNDDGEHSNGPDVWSRFGLSESEGVKRGYQVKGNPQVQVFSNSKFKLQVALNTNQFGRTFQDRSHVFTVTQRPSSIPSNAVIHNLNVRGKRGNLAQTFPSSEYDFVPQNLEVKVNEYVHAQWTGSNSNPNGNTGEGKKGTDRHNIAVLAGPDYDSLARSGVYGMIGASKPQSIKKAQFGGLSEKELELLSVFYPLVKNKSMKQLNDAPAHFDNTPKKMTKTGTFNFMCTRNNNFSNRSQKSTLVVKR